MSGHNKWSKIHRQKSVADNKRGALFTKLGNAITAAAKAGGPDPAANFRLQLAIDQARQANVPKDNIQRAIARGAGGPGAGALETIVYEGYGPDGVAFMVEAFTDNRNRTSAELKHIFTKHGGNLGGPGAVAWMFELKGVISVAALTEAQQLELIDVGAEDIVPEEGGVTIYTDPALLQTVLKKLNDLGIAIDFAEPQHIPKEKKAVSEKAAENIKKMMDEFEENEDVNNFYTNADF